MRYFHGSWKYFVAVHYRATSCMAKAAYQEIAPGSFPKPILSTFTLDPQASLPEGQQHSTPTMLVSYPALPSEPNRNGSSLLGPKAALQGPPSTLALSSPHSQQLISQQSDTSPICCTPQPYPPFPYYQDAKFF